MASVLGLGTYGYVVGGFPAEGRCCKVANSRLYTTSLLRELTFANAARDALDPELLERLVVLPDDTVFVFDRRTPCLQMAQQRCSLDAHIKSSGRLRRVGQITALHDALVAATEALLGIGLAMCDVAPGNVLLGHDGRWRVCDLGLCRYLGPNAQLGLAFTSCSRPPELFGSAWRLRRVDLAAAHAWAIGATLLYAATGRYATVAERTDEALDDLEANVRGYELGLKRPLPLGYAAVYGDLLRFDPLERRVLASAPPPPDPPPTRRHGTPWCPKLRERLATKVVEFARLTFSPTVAAIVAMRMVDSLCGQKASMTADNTTEYDHRMLAYAALTLASDLVLGNVTPLNGLARASVFGVGHAITDTFKDDLTQCHLLLFRACDCRPFVPTTTETPPWADVELLRTSPDRYYSRR